MRKNLLLCLLAIALPCLAIAQCPAGQHQLKVVLLTDDYASETAWTIKDVNNVTVLSSGTLTNNTLYKDSICVPNGQCYKFKITDAAGDGICCNYGQGNFKYYDNGAIVLADSSFGGSSEVYVGCPNGGNCNTAQPISVGTFTAPNPNSWYKFIPSITGQYKLATCGQNNTCDTKIWVYSYCNGLQYDSTNVATIAYGAHNCGTNQAVISAHLVQNLSYYIRIGDANNSCNGGPINWKLEMLPSYAGCLDTIACNFDPFATLYDTASCLYYPSALCPTGADLIVDSTSLSVSLMIDSINSVSSCLVHEGCMNGYGKRQLVRFDTRIANIGATDFYAGVPPANAGDYSAIYEYDQCHHHWHFEDYAQYLLTDTANNLVPIGYKNGFCVLDLTCQTGLAKFTCSNMGITSGCADIYSRNLDCQWLDITDVPDGPYKLMLRVNWVPRPDFYGRYETDYKNNWARACITLNTNASGQRQVTVQPNCPAYYDCAGVENGLSVRDCNGNCNGTKKTGDLNNDNARNATDVNMYMLGAINGTVQASPCTDLNADTAITVTDAALLADCMKHENTTGLPANHTHQPCVFPDKIYNQTMHADFSIANLDYANQTIEIHMINPNSRLVGYQFKLKGLTLASYGAIDLLPDYDPAIYTNAGGNVIALSSDDSTTQKHNFTAPILRLRWTSIDSNFICLTEVVAAVNEALEEIETGIAPGGGCMPAVPTATNLVATANSNVSYRLYPNPFTNTTTLTIENPGSKLYQVRLTDITGRVLLADQSTGNSYQIERGSLAAGMYILSVEGDGWQVREKLQVR